MHTSNVIRMMMMMMSLLLIFIMISHVCHDRKMISSIDKNILWLLHRIPENITSSHGLEFMFLAPVMESRMEQAIGTLVQCSSFKEPITKGPVRPLAC